MSFAVKELTLNLLKTVLMEDEFRDWGDVGIAMQAYLRCTLGDLQRLAEWAKARGTPVWVRLVKGAYWEVEQVIAEQNGWPVPVFLEKSETDAAFESAAQFLISNHAHLRPAIATHNVRSLAAAIAMAEQAGIPPAGMEFQMLYGYAPAADQGGAGRHGPARASLYAVRKTSAGDGLSRPAIT